jgi:diaminopimelate decarboxylase
MTRTFVIVDGASRRTPRPALYGARHLVVPVVSDGGEEQEVIVCGRSCENDELGMSRLVSDTVAGDLLAMCTIGA